MTGATRATRAIGTTIAGIRVLRGVPLEEAEDVWDAGVGCTVAGAVLIVDDGKVVGGGLSLVMGTGPDRVDIIVEIPMVHVLSGCPFSELN
jgi:hypothetical protein